MASLWIARKASRGARARTSTKERVELSLSILKFLGLAVAGLLAYTRWIDPDFGAANQPVTVEVSPNWTASVRAGVCLVRMGVAVSNPGKRTAYVLGYTASLQRLRYEEKAWGIAFTGTLGSPNQEVQNWQEDKIQDLQEEQEDLFWRRGDYAQLAPGEKYNITSTLGFHATRMALPTN